MPYKHIRLRTMPTHIPLQISYQPERLDPRALVGGAEIEGAPPAQDCCLYAALGTSSRLCIVQVSMKPNAVQHATVLITVVLLIIVRRMRQSISKVSYSVLR